MLADMNRIVVQIQPGVLQIISLQSSHPCFRDPMKQSGTKIHGKMWVCCIWVCWTYISGKLGIENLLNILYFECIFAMNLENIIIISYNISHDAYDTS